MWDVCRQERCILEWWGELRERDHLQDLGSDGRIIKMDLRNMRLGGLDWMTDAGEFGDELWGSVRGGEFLD